MTNTRTDSCALCGREVPLTFHHLIPRKVHRRRQFRKNYTKTALQQGIHVCRLCHNGIHALHDEMTLARQLNTLERLRADPQIARHVAWVRKQRIRK